MAKDDVVVLLDDDSDILLTVGDLLEEEGLPVVAIDHPDLIGDATLEGDPLLFVVDLILPEENGVEVARRTLKREYPHIPIIGISASAGMAEVARRSELFHSVLTKPFDIDVFVEAVNAAGNGSVCVSPTMNHGEA